MTNLYVNDHYIVYVTWSINEQEESKLCSDMIDYISLHTEHPGLAWSTCSTLLIMFNFVSLET